MLGVFVDFISAVMCELFVRMLAFDGFDFAEREQMEFATVVAVVIHSQRLHAFDWPTQSDAS